MRVLIFPAGEINSIELHDALCNNINIEVYGASSIERHGSYIFRNYISGLPMINDISFISEFNNILEENHIDLIFPTHDTVALYLAKNRSKLKAIIITADVYTAGICRDKKLTYNLFANEDFCPKLYKKVECFPVFIKPHIGQGGVGAKILYSYKDIPKAIEWDNYVVTEYLPGSELTIDCLTDSKGILKGIFPRSRERLLSGISVAGQTIEITDEIFRIAQCLNTKLNFLGLWYFQLKQNALGNYKLLEISTRCAGTMCLSRARGVNLPLLSIYAALGYDFDIFENNYKIKIDRTMISRYKFDYKYDIIYLSYDDTLIINKEICLSVIRFIYQCKNAGKHIILLSRDEELLKDMQNFCISENLFEKIIRLTRTQKKVDFIQSENAIFIDNIYEERKIVHEKIGIPVFAVDGIEVLTDWR